MRLDADRKDVLLALVTAAEEQFNTSDWEKLGMVVEGGHIIDEDERLLRSLHYKDDDYGSCVIRVIKSLIEYDPNNIRIIEKYVQLDEYLNLHKTNLHERLYGATTVITNYNNTSAVLDNAEVNKQTERIKAAIENGDPALAIGTSKDLLETVLKQILEKLDQPNEYTDIQLLLKKVQIHLNIDPNSERTKAHTKLKRTLSSLGQLVVGVAEMRNLAGTGHGKTQSPYVDPNHALLVVNTTYTISTYLINLLHDQQLHKTR